MFAVGRFINERDYIEQENLDNISGPSMFLSDKGNDAVFQAFISSDTAQILVGNGGIQSYLQSGAASSDDFAEIGIASKDKSLIGMRTEINNSDNVYHYVNHYDNSYSTKLGIWDDSVGFLYYPIIGCYTVNVRS